MLGREGMVRDGCEGGRTCGMALFGLVWVVVGDDGVMGFGHAENG